MAKEKSLINKKSGAPVMVWDIARFHFRVYQQKNGEYAVWFSEGKKKPKYTWLKETFETESGANYGILKFLERK